VIQAIQKGHRERERKKLGTTEVVRLLQVFELFLIVLDGVQGRLSGVSNSFKWGPGVSQVPTTTYNP
jgi:hypothetical protein